MVWFQFPYFSGDESEMQKGGLIWSLLQSQVDSPGTLQSLVDSLRCTSSDSLPSDVFTETQGMLLLFSL